MSYPGFDAFTAPARASAELWRTLLGALLIVTLYAIGATVIIAGGGFVFESLGIATRFDILEGRTPAALLLVLFHFIAMAGAAILVTRLLHKRGGWTLVGDRHRLWSDFRSMAGTAIVVSVIGATGVILLAGVDWKLGIGTWLIFLPLALPLILLQTGAEELVFRGYLQQQLGARVGAGLRAVWMLIPSLLFAAGHVEPSIQGGNYWAIFAITAYFALITADVTARTGSIGAAWGLHFINNVQALLIFSLAGPLSGLSLGSVGIEASSPDALPLFALDALALTVIYLLWRRRHG